LRRVRELTGDIPLVAIGGIRLENIEDVLKAGADSVAVINLLLNQPAEIERRTRELLATL
jgi:thiamine-phosphate pyrophosphorylase